MIVIDSRGCYPNRHIHCVDSGVIRTADNWMRRFCLDSVHCLKTPDNGNLILSTKIEDRE